MDRWTEVVFILQYFLRLKSSFVLGEEQPPEIPSAKKKSLNKKVNPITGKVESGDKEDQSQVTEEKIVERFEKSCKIPPGGHCTPLW